MVCLLTLTGIEETWMMLEWRMLRQKLHRVQRKKLHHAWEKNLVYDGAYLFIRVNRDCEKKSVNKILLWYARVVSLKIRLFTFVLYITVVDGHVKSRRFSAHLARWFIRYSGRRPSYIILSSPYTCAQFRIVLVHFFVASNVARYSAFKRAVSLGNTLLWRFSFR